VLIVKRLPSYLSLNRHGTYYFRMVIPAPVRELFQGKREIRRSLKTDNQRLAVKRARQRAVRLESVFDRVLSMTAQDDYEPSEEDWKLFDELTGENQRGGWGEAELRPQAPQEPKLSNAEIEPVSGEAKSNACWLALITGLSRLNKSRSHAGCSSYQLPAY
jgi:hypothetical protein